MELSCKQAFLSPMKSYSSTGNKLTLSWTNIFIAIDIMNTGIQSPVFSNDPYHTLKWSMRLSSDRSDGSYYPTDNVSLFLCCEASDKSDVRAKFRFHLDDRAGEAMGSPLMEEYCVFKYGTEQGSYGYKNFSNRLTLDGYRFDIHCDIEVHPDDMNIVVQDASKVPDGTLLDDMGSVFESPKYTDFVITHDGDSFPVHKAILSARSPVFAAMCGHDTKEQQENCVDIKDITPEALKEMLRFVYTDRVKDIKAVARDLLAPADKYALGRLKIMCEKALVANLVVENAADTLILADLHGANELKTQAIDFIRRHTINVMDTPGFKSMMESYPYLMAEIMRALVTIGGLTSVKPPDTKPPVTKPLVTKPPVKRLRGRR